MNDLKNLALAPVRLTAAILTAAVTDRLDALTSQIENVKSDNEDTADVLSELIDRLEDLELASTGFSSARGALERVRVRVANQRETVVA